jgi:putative membrane protein insertion efficiency factor
MLSRKLGTALITGIVLLFSAASEAGAGPWGPWSVSSDAPVLLKAADREAVSPVKLSRQEVAITAVPFIWMLKLYQGLISPLDGDRCPMSPTCSLYSVQSIRKHGPLIGVIMTSDRLIHEADEQRFAPLIRVGNRYRYADPVENNDFWWYKP